MMNVLLSKSQISEARKRLNELNASALDSNWAKVLRKFGFYRSIAVGDVVKSWDVLSTLDFIIKELPHDAAILDIGSYASEIIIALHKKGFTNLSGVDLNPQLTMMPHCDDINFQISDFLNTPFRDSSFDAITSISVIEHGFDGKALLSEVSRLLVPNGYFIASFDYWPEKIDTTNIKFFNMDWLIFSKKDIQDFITLSSAFGMVPTGAINLDAKQAPIRSAEKEYTFGWIVLKKSV